MSDETDRLARAGEYVLGLLDGPARKEAEAALLSDPQFRQAVENFARAMSRLDLTVEPTAVPAGMWERIASEVAETPQQKPPAPALVASRGRTARTPSAIWRRYAMAASLALGVGIGYLGGWLTISQPRPVVLVVLETPNNTPGAFFEAFADNSVRIVPLQDFPVPEGQVLQVWTLYDREVGPVSLGTLARAEVAVLQGKQLPPPAADQLYEITLEPAPGSPTDRPTGPILVKGFAKRPPA